MAAQSCTAELIAADNAEISVLLHLSAGIKVHGIHKMTHVHDGAVRKRCSPVAKKCVALRKTEMKADRCGARSSSIPDQRVHD